MVLKCYTFFRCPPTDQSALKKLIEDIYDGDMLGSFRDYCLAESDWQEVVLFLDIELAGSRTLLYWYESTKN